jgi:hypothetical protein
LKLKINVQRQIHAYVVLVVIYRCLCCEEAAFPLLSISNKGKIEVGQLFMQVQFNKQELLSNSLAVRFNIHYSLDGKKHHGT